jgi:hypothetical protein
MTPNYWISAVFFFASRLRTTSAAAAAPKSRIIGGAGTGEGPPDDPLDAWLEEPPRLDEWWPLLVQPLEVLQPLEPFELEP